jgi:hypothetical protein
MTDYPGRRKNDPSDPTDQPTSDPVPTGEDVINRHQHGHETPRKYDEPLQEPDSSEEDPTLNTQI